jgi:hypothetical protein
MSFNDRSMNAVQIPSVRVALISMLANDKNFRTDGKAGARMVGSAPAILINSRGLARKLCAVYRVFAECRLYWIFLQLCLCLWPIGTAEEDFLASGHAT